MGQLLLARSRGVLEELSRIEAALVLLEQAAKADRLLVDSPRVDHDLLPVLDHLRVLVSV